MPTAEPSEAARSLEHLFASRYQSSDLESENGAHKRRPLVSWPGRGRATLARTASAALAACAETENLWRAQSNKDLRGAARWTFMVEREGSVKHQRAAVGQRR